nr:MAG TPA: hypothetical protein [Caudoviricetes sp.]
MELSITHYKIWILSGETAYRKSSGPRPGL